VPTWTYVLAWIALGISTVFWVGFAITFVAERVWRGFGLALLLAFASGGALAALQRFEFPGRPWVILGLLTVAVVFVLLIIPRGRNQPIRIVGEQTRVDERDAVFHRFYRLQPGTPEFELYYRDHPEKLEFDNEVRSLPPLSAPHSHFYHPFTSAFQAATFTALEDITREIEWKSSPLGESPVEATPEEFTHRIKGFARYLGADLVGTAKLNPAYVYSHIGRSPGPWGREIRLDHTHAVAIAVEMHHNMVEQAPGNATTTETAKQYFEAAKIAMQVARYVNFLGYEARAHIDANYRVLCIPIAVDAGLGELGRLGLLITPEFGPRVRLAVVTTDLPLAEDRPRVFGVREFCEICMKCATVCPSESVDGGKKALYAGVEKWQTRRDTCYRMWRTYGSDCNLCVKVCPYSSPGSPVHRLVRWMTTRNDFARRAALWGDRIFYGDARGAYPPLPEWHKT